MVIREAVVEAIVRWRLDGSSEGDDPDRRMWALINEASGDELMEALRRLRRRLLPS